MTDDMVYNPSHLIANDIPEKAGAELYENIRQSKLTNEGVSGKPAFVGTGVPSNVSVNTSASCERQRQINSNGTVSYRINPACVQRTKVWNPPIKTVKIKQDTIAYRQKGGNIKEREDRGKKVLDQSLISKSLIREQDGMKIFNVDDNYVKTHIYADFTEGGNGYAYPNFVPMDEIWVAKDKDKQNKEAIILHELAEVKKMKIGMSYDNAHEIANKVEMKLRKKFQNGGVMNLDEIELTKEESNLFNFLTNQQYEISKTTTKNQSKAS